MLKSIAHIYAREREREGVLVPRSKQLVAYPILTKGANSISYVNDISLVIYSKPLITIVAHINKNIYAIFSALGTFLIFPINKSRKKFYLECKHPIYPFLKCNILDVRNVSFQIKTKLWLFRMGSRFFWHIYVCIWVRSTPLTKVDLYSIISSTAYYVTTCLLFI